MRRSLVLLLMISASDGAFAGQGPKAKSSASTATLDEQLAGFVAGETQSCVNMSELRGARVVPGSAVIYRTRGAMIYVNRPVGAAPTGLDDDTVLKTRTTTGLFCANDQVDLVDRSSRFSIGFLILGPFQSYRRAE